MYACTARYVIQKLALLLLVSVTGCASMGNFDPFSTSGYRDTTEEPQDEWSFVGKEGRGDSALIDENDPFKPILMSPKARSIERNLGYK